MKPVKDPHPARGADARSANLVPTESVFDIVILLDSDLRVTELSAAVAPGANGLGHWIGRPVVDLLSPECVPKLPLLLADGGHPETARWRHLNFLDGGDVLPFLAKYFPPAQPERAQRLLGLRDLRSISEMQKSFQSLQTELESFRARAQDAADDSRNVLISAAARDVGRKSLSRIVEETVQSLERRCLADAIEMSAGDLAAAARLLRLSEDALIEKAAGLGLPLALTMSRRL